MVAEPASQPVDVEALLGAIRNPRDATILGLMAYAGVAPGEIRSIDLEDVSLKTGRLFVRGRRGKSRCVTLTPAARGCLEAYIAVRPAAPDRALFITNEPARISNRQIRKIAAHAGVRGFDLRHHFVKTALAHGADPQTVRDQVGVESMNALFRSIEGPEKSADVIPLRGREKWQPMTLRNWVLDLIERQLEQASAKGVQHMPASFKWPPLPPEDLVRLKAANGNIARTIEVIFDLLEAKPVPISEGRFAKEERQACLTAPLSATAG